MDWARAWTQQTAEGAELEHRRFIVPDGQRNMVAVIILLQVLAGLVVIPGLAVVVTEVRQSRTLKHHLTADWSAEPWSAGPARPPTVEGCLPRRRNV